MIDELEGILQSAVCRVLRTMLNFDAHVVPLGKDVVSGGAHIASSVGFIGKMTGVVYVYVSEPFARRMTGRLLGLAEKDLEGEEMVNDAMGELANMIVGNFKSALVERGLSCVLTIPSIVRGTHFSIEAVSSTTRRVLCFRCDDSHHLVVETLIKLS